MKNKFIMEDDIRINELVKKSYSGGHERKERMYMKSRKNRRRIKGLIISGLICIQLSACESIPMEENVVGATSEIAGETVDAAWQIA